MDESRCSAKAIRQACVNARQPADELGSLESNGYEVCTNEWIMWKDRTVNRNEEETRRQRQAVTWSQHCSCPARVRGGSELGRQPIPQGKGSVWR